MSRNCIKSILYIWNLNLEVSERKCGFIGGTGFAGCQFMVEDAEIPTPFNNMMELYFEDFDIDGLLVKYESGKYSVQYATELTELAGGQKLVRLYDPSGNLIEVRTPLML